MNTDNLKASVLYYEREAEAAKIMLKKQNLSEIEFEAWTNLLIESMKKASYGCKLLTEI